MASASQSAGSSLPPKLLRRGSDSFPINVLKFAPGRQLSFSSEQNPLGIVRRRPPAPRPAPVAQLPLSPQKTASGMAIVASDTGAAKTGPSGTTSRAPQQSVGACDAAVLDKEATVSADRTLIAPVGTVPVQRPKPFQRRTREINMMDDAVRKTKMEEALPWFLAPMEDIAALERGPTAETAEGTAVRSTAAGTSTTVYRDSGRFALPESDRTTPIYVGMLEDQQSDYMLLALNTSGEAFDVWPVESWYRFVEHPRYQRMTPEQIEEIDTFRARRVRRRNILSLSGRSTNTRLPSGSHGADRGAGEPDEVDGDTEDRANHASKNSGGSVNSESKVKKESLGVSVNGFEEDNDDDDDDDDDDDYDDDEGMDGNVLAGKGGGAKDSEASRERRARRGRAKKRLANRGNPDELDFDPAEGFQDDEEEHVYGDLSEEQAGRQKEIRQQYTVGLTGGISDTEEEDEETGADLVNLGRGLSTASSNKNNGGNNRSDGGGRKKLSAQGRVLKRALLQLDRNLYDSVDEDEDDSEACEEEEVPIGERGTLAIPLAIQNKDSRQGAGDSGDSLPVTSPSSQISIDSGRQKSPTLAAGAVPKRRKTTFAGDKTDTKNSPQRVKTGGARGQAASPSKKEQPGDETESSRKRRNSAESSSQSPLKRPRASTTQGVGFGTKTDVEQGKTPADMPMQAKRPATVSSSSSQQKGELSLQEMLEKVRTEKITVELLRQLVSDGRISKSVRIGLKPYLAMRPDGFLRVKDV